MHNLSALSPNLAPAMLGLTGDKLALLRYAKQLDELLAEILNSDAEMGVSFAEVIDAVDDLYVSHEPARHLVNSRLGRRTRPTHVPPIEADPVLHVLTQLAFEVASLPLTVRTIKVVDRLLRFKHLNDHLLRIANGTTRFQYR